MLPSPSPWDLSNEYMNCGFKMKWIKWSLQYVSNFKQLLFLPWKKSNCLKFLTHCKDHFIHFEHLYDRRRAHEILLIFKIYVIKIMLRAPSLRTMRDYSYGLQLIKLADWDFPFDYGYMISVHLYVLRWNLEVPGSNPPPCH